MASCRFALAAKHWLAFHLVSKDYIAEMKYGWMLGQSIEPHLTHKGSITKALGDSKT